MPTDRGARPSLRAAWPRWGVATALGIVVVTAIALFGMGRSLRCGCGTASPWSWDIRSLHNSQLLLDPYTSTHVLHGVLYYGASPPSRRAPSRRRGWPVWVSAAGFLGVEAVVLSTIRDSLLLDVLMLVHPVEAIEV